MVRHIIVWKLKDQDSEEKKEQIKNGIKSNLEGLAGVIPGLREIHVYKDGIPSSTGDLMLDSFFESADDLKKYSVNPAHVAVAEGYVRPYVASRLSFDFEV